MRLSPAILVVVLALSAAPGRSSDSPDLQGVWNGVITIVPARMEVDFQVVVRTEGDKDIWFPTQGSSRYPLAKWELQDGRVEFAYMDSNGVVSSFTGTLSDDGETIEGDISEQGQSAPFELQRVTRDPGTQTYETTDLTVLSRDGADLRNVFNRDRDDARLIVIMSPTCGMCRMGARMIDRYILERFDDPQLKVYMVWEPNLDGDDEQAAREATLFLSGERVSHFWSADQVAGRAFQGRLGLEEPAWDVFLAYSPGATWEDEAPEPDYYMHNLRKGKGSLPEDRRLNAETLAEKVGGLLAGPPASAPAGVGDTRR